MAEADSLTVFSRATCNCVDLDVIVICAIFYFDETNSVMKYANIVMKRHTVFCD